jgi:hypothetical protein
MADERRRIGGVGFFEPCQGFNPWQG